MQDDAPIIAIATPPGHGGVGIVRVSSPTLAALDGLIRQISPRPLVPRIATLLTLSDDAGAAIDQGVGLFFPGPASYTGEHVFEFQGHGGPAVLQAVLRRLLQLGQSTGLRLARPGEFTEKAFLNGKIDLTQAEAVADLIEARSQSAAKAAAASLCGEFSRRVEQLATTLVNLRLLVEATLDFPEEEIDFLEKAGAREALMQARAQLQHLRDQAEQGARLRDGVRIVLAGRPNVGKSSLLNALAQDDVAIVSPVPGTTRDRISQTLEIGGLPVVLTDTAGLRDTTDEVETIGIERTRASLRQADLIFHILDATEGMTLEDQSLALAWPSAVPIVRIFNKADLLDDDWPPSSDDAVYISAQTGVGLDGLQRIVFQRCGLLPGQTFAFLARQRHLEALKCAADHLDQAAAHARHDDRVLDLFAEELRLAHDALGEITGRLVADDLLGLIFGRFCIGK
ncbi:MAG: tRNA uridine-5-carboxymethylaminomethyl(34) synthesis GTPase MnmE [Burkholderiaceae bacterium]